MAMTEDDPRFSEDSVGEGRNGYMHQGTLNRFRIRLTNKPHKKATHLRQVSPSYLFAIISLLVPMAPRTKKKCSLKRTGPPSVEDINAPQATHTNARSECHQDIDTIALRNINLAAHLNANVRSPSKHPNNPIRVSLIDR